MARGMLFAAACVTATVALSGCGTQEAAVLKTAFEKKIDTANVAMTYAVNSSQGNATLSLNGPYKSNGEGKLPSLDWQLKIDGATPQPITGELISSGDDAFVKYGGDTYEVGKDQIAKLEQEGAAGGGAQQFSAADVQKLLTQAQGWFPQSNTQENAQLNGEAVTRVTGTLDLAAALTDLKALAKQPGLSGAEALKGLSSTDLKQVEQAISDPRFTVDVAKSDGTLRRIAASMHVNGSDSGDLSFSIQFTDVNKPVSIQVPASGKPIADLVKKLELDFGGGSSSSGGAVQGVQG
jgi:hypothetical protein